MTQKSLDISTSSEERIAIFPGSFNPFTIGHLSIVERGLLLFDKIIIAIGVNFTKPTDNNIEERRTAIAKAVACYGDCVEIVIYQGMTVDEAGRHGARFILRGVRSVADFEYERNMADVNRRISGLETIVLFTLPEHGYISSSVVRELSTYGKDVDAFIP